MLLSTKDQGLGRRRRSYSHSSIYSNNRARVSKLSLVSAITDQSSGSNGSGSTVTQDSYNKSKSETTKKKRPKRRKDIPEARPATMEALDDDALSEKATPKEKVDVFAFLVDEDSRDLQDGQPQRLQVSDLPVFDDDQDHEPSPHSIHSDSGVSMDDGSYHLGAASLKPLLPPVAEEQRPMTPGDASTLLRSDWRWPEVPKPSQMSTSGPSIHETRPPAFLDVRRDSRHYIAEPYPACYTPATPEYSPPQPSAFYDLLAYGSPDEENKLSSLPVRRFEAVDGRVLLHLQQDIHLLEHDLIELDAAILTYQSPDANATTSRRPSWQWNQPHMYSARADILHRLQLRLEMYYKQLLLSRQVQLLKDCSKPAMDEAQRLRSILTANSTAADQDLLSIFDDEKDLFHLGPHIGKGTESSSYLPASMVFVTTIFPLMLFKIFTGILNRALIISLTLGVGLCMIEKIRNFIPAGVLFRLPRLSVADQNNNELRRWVLVGTFISIVMALFD